MHRRRRAHAQSFHRHFSARFAVTLYSTSLAPTAVTVSPVKWQNQRFSQQQQQIGNQMDSGSQLTTTTTTTQ
jgi:hypothetical protein